MSGIYLEEKSRPQSEETPHPFSPTFRPSWFLNHFNPKKTKQKPWKLTSTYQTGKLFPYPTEVQAAPGMAVCPPSWVAPHTLGLCTGTRPALCSRVLRSGSLAWLSHWWGGCWAYGPCMQGASECEPEWRLGVSTDGSTGKNLASILLRMYRLISLSHTHTYTHTYTL